MSGWLYTMGDEEGVREEWGNFRLCKGKWKGHGILKMVEWDRHHYPMYMCDYMNGMNLHHAQP